MSTRLPAREVEMFGVRFKSVLEARWAKTFERWGVPWRYEAARIVLPRSGRVWIPDFYLPREDIMIEVKGDHNERLDKVYEAQREWPHLKMAVGRLGGADGFLCFDTIAGDIWAPLVYDGKMFIIDLRTTAAPKGADGRVRLEPL